MAEEAKSFSYFLKKVCKAYEGERKRKEKTKGKRKKKWILMEETILCCLFD